jgi:hypothetical protein
MKPIVLMKGNDGKVNMTIDEFKKYIDDAYDAGYEDGRRAHVYPWYTTTYSSGTVPASDSITISASDVISGATTGTITSSL